MQELRPASPRKQHTGLVTTSGPQAYPTTTIFVFLLPLSIPMKPTVHLSATSQGRPKPFPNCESDPSSPSGRAKHDDVEQSTLARTETTPREAARLHASLYPASHHCLQLHLHLSLDSYRVKRKRHSLPRVTPKQSRVKVPPPFPSPGSRNQVTIPPARPQPQPTTVRAHFPLRVVVEKFHRFWYPEASKQVRRRHFYVNVLACNGRAVLLFIQEQKKGIHTLSLRRHQPASQSRERKRKREERA